MYLYIIYYYFNENLFFICPIYALIRSPFDFEFSSIILSGNIASITEFF